MPCIGGANFTLSNGRITILLSEAENIVQNRMQKALHRQPREPEMPRLDIT